MVTKFVGGCQTTYYQHSCACHVWSHQMAWAGATQSACCPVSLHMFNAASQIIVHCVVIILLCAKHFGLPVAIVMAMQAEVIISRLLVCCRSWPGQKQVNRHNQQHSLP